MKKINAMLVLSEAISKGAKPFFTKEGHAFIASIINDDSETQQLQSVSS